MPELKRSLGLLGATNVSIGAIIGAGIFVLSGVASGIADTCCHTFIHDCRGYCISYGIEFCRAILVHYRGWRFLHLCR
ncbi:MAG: hypothetical protein J5U19_14795 [Candidatus Methanoperedens sp.]|nr:hypothetical protein [Candidatus Methanoperedens sp.]